MGEIDDFYRDLFQEINGKAEIEGRLKAEVFFDLVSVMRVNLKRRSRLTLKDFKKAYALMGIAGILRNSFLNVV